MKNKVTLQSQQHDELFRHHVLKNTKTVVSLDLLVRAIFCAQSIEHETQKQKLIKHLRGHLDKIKKNRKEKLRRAALREKKKAKTNVYKLFLSYILIFGDV